MSDMTIAFLVLVIHFITSQCTFPITSVKSVLHDPFRNRRVQSTIYFPKTPNRTKLYSFPTMLFMHGFHVPANDYAWIPEHIVPSGYIVALINGVGTADIEFGLDAAFLAFALQNESANNPSSPFYHIVSPDIAVVAGHSLGGGASALVADPSFVTKHSKIPPRISHMVTLSMGDHTIPAAHTIAPEVAIPVLMMAVTLDCVIKPSSNSILDYGLFRSKCKIFFEIVGGTHCHFAEYNEWCENADQKCGQPTITRQFQQNTAAQFMLGWLEVVLAKDPEQWAVYLVSLKNATQYDVIVNELVNVSQCLG